MLVARLGALAALALVLLLLLPTIAGAQQPRIKHGQIATPGEYPWTVALWFTGAPSDYDGQFCGGTLVRPDVVVTAAHCVVHQQPGDFQVIAGRTELSDTAVDHAKHHDVERIALHPLERVETGQEVRYDVAVLTLAAPVTDPEAATIGLAGRHAGAIGDDLHLTVSGWGRIEDDSYPAALRYADIPSVADDDCADAWGEYFSPADMLCALAAGPPVVDSCDGDSGGPLVSRPADPAAPAGVLLYGVVSFGSGNCDDDLAPGVYARVQAPGIHDWLSTALDADPANDPRPKPGGAAGAPVLTGTPQVGRTLTCAPGTFTFDDQGFPATTELRIHRVDGIDSEPVATGAYALTAVDVGYRFICEAVGRIAGAGGYVARTSPTSAPVAPAPPPPTVITERVEVPIPVPVPGPAVTVPVFVPTPQPRVEDGTAPRVRRVRRSCTKKRVCRFAVTVSDAAPSAGVTQVTATLASTVRRSCRRGGRRTTCTSTRFAELRGRARGTRVTLRTKRLAKGRHTLTLLAVDGAGNVQEKPSRTRFRLR